MTNRLTSYCKYACPRIDALLDDYDKDSDDETDYDDSSHCSDTESHTHDCNDETTSGHDDDDDDQSTNGGRRNICTAMMDLLKQFPTAGNQQGVIEYKKTTPAPTTLQSKKSDELVYAIQTSLPTQTFQDEDKRDHPMADMNPTLILNKILESSGYTTTPVSSRKVPPGFFITVNDEMIKAYNHTIMAAIRSNDLKAIRQMHKSGSQKFQICNSFGESLIHTVARRSYAELMDFLLHEAGVSLRVVCDSGRTVMHDACWNASPNFDCFKLILKECPDLILISDDRNFTPLMYAPKDTWGDWCTFLQENPDLIKPKEINKA